ncbi:orotate phosphoribosyltransferase [Leptospira meyeri]|uniref:orotate phosphoribosyltransferase n=2 Tax=Leptospira meyeri TaxID=29508 RepID=UPI000C29A633|nr:orotate phosphoribosyltransferase [Leptospira meyeri]PKA26264.1 orotate phosphoribosyltransferase [Leptospira sp. mixed culture ATI2-C-A1]MCW7487356.1 orotate phosphoribosyltransferase [Leptospira meyeri]PJZ80828.1 orotate phosphoribosyltransferase [Leptospira meyeri]PJZ96332.1 orotate phosphoribosyltransferase [Leptospira meyeri]PKA12687.1 orotate phosphoribosyltransferase [Leptospira meyeri]
MSQTYRDQLFLWMKSHVYRYSEAPFRLASGLESHHYFNCKEITLHPERLATLAECFVEEIIPKLGLDFQAVGGLTLGADPLAYSIALAYQRKGKLIYPLVVRKEAKGHGTGQQIEGFWKETKTCLVVDDVITTGGSTLKAVQALREAGISVTKGICILNREEGGSENLEKSGIQMESIFRKSEFFK